MSIYSVLVHSAVLQLYAESSRFMGCRLHSCLDEVPISPHLVQNDCNAIGVQICTLLTLETCNVLYKRAADISERRIFHHPIYVNVNYTTTTYLIPSCYSELYM